MDFNPFHFPNELFITSNEGKGLFLTLLDYFKKDNF